MNTLCAAGTGSFLSSQARRLGVEVEQFGEIALSSTNPTPIAARCTVFAESDLVHKIQMGHKKEDIIAGLCNAVANNYLNNIGKGKKIAIFPQGTRAKTVKIEEGSAKEGVAMFSIRTGTPVVPMMYNRKIKAFRRTKLLIGEPIYPDETRKKDKEYVSEYANLIIEKMNGLLEGETK